MTLFQSTPTTPELLYQPAPLVLHVTEALGGGLEAAILDYARSTPQYRHALLCTRRGDYATADPFADVFVEVRNVGRGALALARSYRSALLELQPAVVHLHSAWAGLIGRAPGTSMSRVPVVYSPHSYFFERHDVGTAKRVLAWWLERLLATRTELIAALSPHEVEEAHRLGARAVFVPNVVRVPRALHWSGDASDEVIAVGRVAAQKDPRFFLEVVDEARRRLPHQRWTWIGDGEPALVQELRDRGVEVTGWMPRTEVLERLAGAAAYLHTAAWEGSPIVLLEAEALGVPVVARSIDSLTSLGYDGGLHEPAAVAQRLAETLSGQRSAPSMSHVGSAADQIEALSAAYAQAVAAASTRGRSKTSGAQAARGRSRAGRTSRTTAPTSSRMTRVDA